MQDRFWSGFSGRHTFCIILVDDDANRTQKPVVSSGSNAERRGSNETGRWAPRYGVRIIVAGRREVPRFVVLVQEQRILSRRCGPSLAAWPSPRAVGVEEVGLSRVIGYACCQRFNPSRLDDANSLADSLLELCSSSSCRTESGRWTTVHNHSAAVVRLQQGA